MIGAVKKLLALLVVVVGLIYPVSSASAANLEVTIGVGDNILEVVGYTSPSAEVSVLENNVVIGSTTADASGQFQIILTNQTTGLRNIKVYAQDTDNRQTDIYSQTINVAAHSTTTLEIFLPPTVELGVNSLLAGESLLVKGSSLPSSTIVVRVDNNNDYTTTTNLNGSWQILIPTSGYYTGQHVLYAYANAGGGLISEPTLTKSFIVLSSGTDTAPPPPSFRLSKPIITFPSDGYRASNQSLEIEGISDANIQIELWDNDRLVGSVFSNSQGQWRISYRLESPEHVLKVRACIAQRCGPYSDPITVYFTGHLDGSALKLTLDQYRWFNIIAGRPLRLMAQFEGGSTPYTFFVEWGDGETEKFNVDEEQQEIALEHIYLQPGLFSASVILYDSEGQMVERFFTASVIEKTINWVFIISAPVIVALPVGYILFRRWLINRKSR